MCDLRAQLEDVRAQLDEACERVGCASSAPGLGAPSASGERSTHGELPARADLSPVESVDAVPARAELSPVESVDALVEAERTASRLALSAKDEALHDANTQLARMQEALDVASEKEAAWEAAEQARAEAAEAAAAAAAAEKRGKSGRRSSGGTPAAADTPPPLSMAPSAAALATPGGLTTPASGSDSGRDSNSRRDSGGKNPQHPLFPICGDPISPICQKFNSLFE